MRRVYSYEAMDSDFTVWTCDKNAIDTSAFSKRKPELLEDSHGMAARRTIKVDNETWCKVHYQGINDDDINWLVNQR